MRKLIITAFFSLLSLVLIPSAVMAQSAPQPIPSMSPTGTPTQLVHAYNPVVWNNPAQVTPAVNPAMTYGPTVRTRVDNWTTGSQSKLVCVEAMQGGVKNHVGCLRVDLAPAYSTNPDMGWAREFDAPLTSLHPGSYNVVYNSQDHNGNWYQLTNLQGQLVGAQVTK